MEEYIANKVISKVYRGKTGKGQYGPWVAWNFNIEGDDRKFSCFSGGKKPEPVEGAFVQMMKYETVTNGKYTNHNVKEMALGKPENNEPRQEPGPPDDYEPPGECFVGEQRATPPTAKKSLPVRNGDEKLSFYVSYAKDVQTSLIMTGNIQEGDTLDSLTDGIMRAGLRMHKIANGEDIPF